MASATNGWATSLALTLAPGELSAPVFLEGNGLIDPATLDLEDMTTNLSMASSCDIVAESGGVVSLNQDNGPGFGTSDQEGGIVTAGAATYSPCIDLEGGTLKRGASGDEADFGSVLLDRPVFSGWTAYGSTDIAGTTNIYPGCTLHITGTDAQNNGNSFVCSGGFLNIYAYTNGSTNIAGFLNCTGNVAVGANSNDGASAVFVQCGNASQKPLNEITAGNNGFSVFSSSMTIESDGDASAVGGYVQVTGAVEFGGSAFLQIWAWGSVDDCDGLTVVGPIIIDSTNGSVLELLLQDNQEPTANVDLSPLVSTAGGVNNTGSIGGNFQQNTDSKDDTYNFDTVGMEDVTYQVWIPN